MSLNIQGCPSDVRFVVLKMERLDFWHSNVKVVHSYIGSIELKTYYDAGVLHNCRVLPRPKGGFDTHYHWPEPSIGEMWEEALNMKELEEYLDA